jgi:hypothetical protein
MVQSAITRRELSIAGKIGEPHCVPNWVEDSGNHQPLRAVKLNQMRFEGELNDAFGLALAPGLVNSRHEFTERLRLPCGTGFLFGDLVVFHNLLVVIAF